MDTTKENSLGKIHFYQKGPEVRENDAVEEEGEEEEGETLPPLSLVIDRCDLLTA